MVSALPRADPDLKALDEVVVPEHVEGVVAEVGVVGVAAATELQVVVVHTIHVGV